MDFVQKFTFGEGGHSFSSHSPDRRKWRVECKIRQDAFFSLLCLSFLFLRNCFHQNPHFLLEKRLQRFALQPMIATLLTKFCGNFCIVQKRNADCERLQCGQLRMKINRILSFFNERYGQCRHGLFCTLSRNQKQEVVTIPIRSTIQLEKNLRREKEHYCFN